MAEDGVASIPVPAPELAQAVLSNPALQIFRAVFDTYELLAHLSVRADQLGLNTCEIPVTRAYPKGEKMPTKISPLKGNLLLLKILFSNLWGAYLPHNAC